jgi:hypothetical protein
MGNSLEVTSSSDEKMIKKLSRSELYRNCFGTEKDLSNFAKVLSNVGLLQTEFFCLDGLKFDVKQVLQEDGDFVEIVNSPIKPVKTHEDTEYHDEYEYELIEYDEILDRSCEFEGISVKFCLSQNSAGYLQTAIQSYMGPYISLIGMMPQFGFLHSSIIFGKWKIEWNNTEIVIPRPIKAKESLFCVDLFTLNSKQEAEQFIKCISDTIVDWNVNFSYAQNGSVEKKTGNCQQFVSELLRRAKRDACFDNLPEGIQTVLKKVQETGMMKMELRITKEFGSYFGITGNCIEFSTHGQLDRFVSDLCSKDVNFMSSRIWKTEKMLCKAFDRAFWLRWRREPSNCDFCQENCPFKNPVMRSFIV